MVRVLLCASHFKITNGYSIVAYELAKHLATKEDVELTYYGFQYFNKSNTSHEKERQLPSNVQVYDAFENENPKGLGFGFDQIADFCTLNKPDIIIIYNDMVVVSTIMEKLTKVTNKNFKIMVYMDQVYAYQKMEYINLLNAHSDYVLTFSDYWEKTAKWLGIKRPTGYLQHGFNPMIHYPVPMKICRDYYNLKHDDFIVLSLNRNQPRKRYDLLLQAWVEFISRHLEEPVKLLIATSMTGGWDLMAVYNNELKKRGLTLEQGLKHVIFIDNPQNLTDEEINILYNLGDISISTVDGEGWGLCSYQQAGIGKAQILPNVGGHKDFFTGNNSQLLEPKMTFYIDQSRDNVGGEAELIDFRDAADSLDAYYADIDLRKDHGEKCRKGILEKYKWPVLGEKLYNIINEVNGFPTFAMRDALNPQLIPVQSQVQSQFQSPQSLLQSKAEPVIPSSVKLGPKQSDKISLTDIASLCLDIDPSSAPLTQAPVPVPVPVPEPVPEPVKEQPSVKIDEILLQNEIIAPTPKPVPVPVPVPVPEPVPLTLKVPEPVLIQSNVDQPRQKIPVIDDDEPEPEPAFDIKKLKKTKVSKTQDKSKADDIKERLQNKLAKKKKEEEKKEESDEELDIESIKKLQAKLNKLLSKVS